VASRATVQVRGRVISIDVPAFLRACKPGRSRS